MQLGATSYPDDPATVENESLPPAKKVKLVCYNKGFNFNFTLYNIIDPIFYSYTIGMYYKYVLYTISMCTN